MRIAAIATGASFWRADPPTRAAKAIALGRIVLAILAAIVANVAAVAAGEGIGNAVFAMPRGAGGMPVLAEASPGALSAVLAAWFAGALAAALAALAVGRRRWLAWAGAGITFAGIVFSVASFAHPPWMIAAGLALPPLAAILAQRIVRVRR